MYVFIYWRKWTALGIWAVGRMNTFLELEIRLHLL